MGWLDKEHQEKVRRKFHLRTAPVYLCDVCDNPTPLGEPPVIDPRKGYHHWPKSIPKAVRTLMGREPRWTSCLKCDRERRDAIRHKREHKQRKFLRVVSKLIEKIKHKPVRGYWTKKKCIQKMHEYDSRLVSRAIRTLVKDKTFKVRDDAYLLR